MDVDSMNPPFKPFCPGSLLSLVGKYPAFCPWCGNQSGTAQAEHSHFVCEKCATKLSDTMPLGIDDPEERKEENENES